MHSAHAGLSLVAALSNSPIWNFPLSLYGLVVVGNSESSDGGDSVRQVSLSPSPHRLR